MNFLQKLWANKIVRYVVGYLVAPVALSLVLHVSVFGHGYDIHVHKDEGQVNPTVDVQPTPAPPKDVALNIVDTEPAIPDDLHFLVQEYAGDAGWNPADAVRVFECESGDRADAIADTDRELSVGLAQINVRVHKTELAMDQFARTNDTNAIVQWLEIPRNNIMFAAYLYKREGFQPWSCAHKLGLVK